MRIFLFLIAISSACFGQISGAGSLGCSGAPVTGTALNNGTAVGNTQALLTNQAAVAALVQLDQTTTITNGVITFESSKDATNWTPVPPNQVIWSIGPVRSGNPYPLQPSTNQEFTILMGGATNLRTNLTQAITGSGSVTPYTTALCANPLWAMAAPLPAYDANAGGLLGQLVAILRQGTTLSVPLNQKALPVVEAAPAPSANPCNGPNVFNKPVSTSANAVLLAGMGGKLTRICGGALVATTAGSFSLVEGTGSVCATGLLAVVGSTTAANGPAFAANGGSVQATQTAVPGNDLCLLLTGTGLIGGNLMAVYF